MQYINHYQSPLGRMLAAADEVGLTGLWFEGQKYFARSLDKEHREADLPIFEKTKEWLDIYFSGKEPKIEVPVHFTGTVFQNRVWKELMGIPYGRTVTYGEIARRAAEKSEGKGISARAVGGAAGRNPISLIVPCHRVVGADGSLTGYAAGIDRKVKLLKLEKADMSGLFLPGSGRIL